MKISFKLNLLVMFSLLMVPMAFGRWVSQEEVRQAAMTTLEKPLFKETFPAVTIRAIEDLDGLWCVHLAPKGHLVFSGSTLHVPVLRFSTTDYVMPQQGSPAFVIALAQRSRAKFLEAANQPDEVAEARWEALLNPVTSVTLFSVEEDPSDEADDELPTMVELPELAWSQCLPWNDFCPQRVAESDATDWYKNRAPVGCAVTMYSQLLHYYQWPARLDGIYANTLIGENCALNPKGIANYEMRFNGALPIAWNALYEAYWTKNEEDVWEEAFPSEDERLAVARVGLLFDILSNISFGEESGTTLLDVCTNEWYCFGADDARKEKENASEGNKYVDFTPAQLTEMKQTLASGMPIPASIPGHGVLVYGYKEEGESTYFKINYGWGNLDDTNAFYEANNSDLDTWLLGHMPNIQVQVAPLPKVVNVDDLPTLMWMVPEYHEPDPDDTEDDGEFSSFTIVATPYASDTLASSTLTFDDPVADADAYEAILLKDSSGAQTTALSIKASDPLMKAYYHFPEAFIPTEQTEFTCNLVDLREEIDPSISVTVEVQLWSETTRMWQTLATFPESNTEELPDSLTIPLGEAAEAFCRLRLVVGSTYVKGEEDEEGEADEEEEEEGEEEEEEEGITCYALYNLNVSDVYAQDRSTSEKLDATTRAYTLEGLLNASDGAGTRYRIQVKPETFETPATFAETFTRVTTAPVVFPTITKVESLAKNEALVDDILLKADLDGLAGLRVTCNEAVSELRAQTSCPTLIPDDAITIYRYDGHIFDVVVKSPQTIAALDGSRMILWLEAKTAQGNVTTKEVVLALRAATASIDYRKPLIEWDVDEDTLEIPHYWFRKAGLVTEEETPETATDWETLATADADNDGLLNWQEYLCGTSPIDDTETLQILGLTFNDDGTLNAIEYTPTTAEVGDIILEGKTSLADETWSAADVKTHRFFRLRVTKKE